VAFVVVERRSHEIHNPSARSCSTWRASNSCRRSRTAWRIRGGRRHPVQAQFQRSAPARGAVLEAIHALRSPPLLIAIDHEGGACSASAETASPMCRRCVARRRCGIATRHAALRRRAAGIGYLLAAELRACGIDLSFTPVLDLDWGPSGVIGDRAFHKDPAGGEPLAGALIDGLRMPPAWAVGKHFPGHGFVAADSHLAIPVDERSLADMAPDLEPYRRLRLDGVMPAHVIYPAGRYPARRILAGLAGNAAHRVRLRRRGLQRRPVDGRR
jgi:beta-glucosidase-like glycosyl hydrolase